MHLAEIGDPNPATKSMNRPASFQSVPILSRWLRSRLYMLKGTRYFEPESSPRKTITHATNSHAHLGPRVEMGAETNLATTSPKVHRKLELQSERSNEKKDHSDHKKLSHVIAIPDF